jgi:hypothetical protein
MHGDFALPLNIRRTRLKANDMGLLKLEFSRILTGDYSL